MADIEPETGTCDLNPRMATMGEWARGKCNGCHKPLDQHLTPEQWARIDKGETVEEVRRGAFIAQLR